MKKELVSYWKNNYEEVYSTDDGLKLVRAYYDGDKALGLQWNDKYPNARGRLAPFYLNDEMGRVFLLGLGQKAITNNDQEMLKKIIEAIEFLGDK